MGEMIEKILVAVSDNVILERLLDTSLGASVIVLALLLLRPLMKRLPRIGMYALWIVLGIRLLCPVSVAGIYSLLPDGVERQISETRQGRTAEGLKNRWESDGTGDPSGYRPAAAANQSLGEARPVGGDALRVSEAQSADARGSGDVYARKTDAQPPSAATLLLTAWGVGAGLLIFYLIYSLLRIRFLLSDARKLEGNVYTHPAVENSFVAGIFSPKIYLAENISAEDMAYILCHERVHIRRRDYLIKPLMFLACSLYWFNPLIWVAYRLMEKDMEVSCDEAVIRRMGEDEKKNYSALLVDMTSSGRTQFRGNTAFSAGVVKERIASIMRYRKPTVITSVLLMAAVVLFGCSVMSEPKQSSAPERNNGEDGRQTYVEQMVKKEDREAVFDLFGIKEPSFDLPMEYGSQGNLISLCIKSEKDGGQYPCVAEMIDGKWEKWSLAGLEECGEKLKGKPAVIGGMELDGGDNLYVKTTEYNVPLSEKQIKQQTKYYAVHERLYRIDRKTGELSEIVLPEKTYREIYPDSSSDMEEDAIIANVFTILEDGNIVLLSPEETGLGGVYDWRTGERVTEIESSLDIMNGSMICKAGDGFFAVADMALADMAEGSGKSPITIHVFDEGSGREEYALNTGVSGDEVWGENTHPKFAWGIRENEIFIATAEGISEAVYGEDSFSRVVDADKDKVYYLSASGTEFRGDIYKGAEGEYYLPGVELGDTSSCDLKYIPQSE